MSAPATQAIFLSYAREDLDAARRIADALRSHGIEAWFDQSELRGGDAWDQKIRSQVKACALFVPVISGATQARREGYFRLEWKLAAQRTHTIADGTPFLLPVVLDATRDAEALVPEEFRAVQWTRLTDGEVSAAFVAHVRKLLNDPRAPAASAIPPARSSGTALSAGKKTRSIPVLAAIAGVALALASYVAWRPRGHESPPAAKPLAAATPAVPVPAEKKPAAPPDDKSIAVLPFADMSATKDQEYMSDGLAEELLNLLAKIPALRVTSRSSAFAFKGKGVELPEIARRLNVAHILEGSVRKSGNRLRITAQLIDARTDIHLWSETYDRDMTDIFAVQDEIAAAVAIQLKLALLGTAAKAKRTDPRAYELYLQAGYIVRQAKPDRYEQSIRLLREAVTIDPNYAAGWNSLGLLYSGDADQGSHRFLSVEEAIRLAREAVAKALALDPDFAWAHIALGRIAMQHDGDLAAAARHVAHALALEAGDPALLLPAANLLTNLGRLDQSIALREYAIARDPVNPLTQFNLGVNYYYAGRLDQAIAATRTSLNLAPGRTVSHYIIGLALLAKGDAPAALAEMQQETSPNWKQIGLPFAYHALGKNAEADDALATLIREGEKGWSYNIASVLAFRGEIDRAFAWLEQAVAYHDSGLSTITVDPLWPNSTPTRAGCPS